MKITFSINHDGEVLVLVGGEVQALAKDREGYEVIKPVQCNDNTVNEEINLKYAKELAQSLYDNYYSKKADNVGKIELLDDIDGVLSQIDNMTTGLISDNVTLSTGVNLSLISDEKLLGELLSRTYESNAPIKTSYGEGMKVFTVGIGNDEVATVSMHCNAIDIIRAL